ncbi:unnamed protein product [Bursaphelenchus xylophilus]|uniref:(pine wood nematode) hypothetical protein n=1 Tax=Bursaphelenchus xylophilus TaxID=6326 RepID=A0A1I7SW87_BURXY|nr:unnamed protein product [Bursaphelenchus xylophilus]CAG9098997.1 unnamed protein product [Bursaphelenchus xylophilus]
MFVRLSLALLVHCFLVQGLPSGFDLLRIERRFEEEFNRKQRLNARSIDDPETADEKCQKECNEKLRTSLDMVKAHTSFGSVGVPSVTDKEDLIYFCKFDAENDRCLRDCGYEIQFNMRDYVCKARFDEMVNNLPCYARSAPQLKRVCGARRCGPYEELELSLNGFGKRCRSVLCDLSCMQNVLLRNCGMSAGSRAYKFLLDYSRVQVATWIRDSAQQLQQPVSKVIPRTCSTLFCEQFDTQNCTYVPAI